MTCPFAQFVAQATGKPAPQPSGLTPREKAKATRAAKHAVVLAERKARILACVAKAGKIGTTAISQQLGITVCPTIQALHQMAEDSVLGCLDEGGKKGCTWWVLGNS